ncbi:hypothetical protein C1H46_014092 [Malus baccata]|uniref:Uncharacterized protein n=1 Tax=Malus baccata TaxID=106549 RepID=A0A540MPE7_MALBA|nr:hypothetical protein C1H46_014092 [Malus baccata]
MSRLFTESEKEHTSNKPRPRPPPPVAAAIKYDMIIYMLLMIVRSNDISIIVFVFGRKTGGLSLDNELTHGIHEFCAPRCVRPNNFFSITSNHIYIGFPVALVLVMAVAVVVVVLLH